MNTTATESVRSRAECEALIRANVRLIGYVRRRLANNYLVAALDPDDVQSEGLQALWQAARSWREDGGRSFAGWAMASIRFRLLQVARQRAHDRRRAVSLDGLDFDLPTADSQEETGL